MEELLPCANPREHLFLSKLTNDNYKHRHTDEHSFKVVSIVLTEIKLCGDVPTRRQCRNLRPGQCIEHGMCLCADTLTRRHLGKRGVGQYVGYGVCGYADVLT